MPINYMKHKYLLSFPFFLILSLGYILRPDSDQSFRSTNPDSKGTIIFLTQSAMYAMACTKYTGNGLIKRYVS